MQEKPGDGRLHAWPYADQPLCPSVTANAHILTIFALAVAKRFNPETLMAAHRLRYLWRAVRHGSAALSFYMREAIATNTGWGALIWNDVAWWAKCNPKVPTEINGDIDALADYLDNTFHRTWKARIRVAIATCKLHTEIYATVDILEKTFSVFTGKQTLSLIHI